jgi:hypothetical protein
MNVVPVSVHDCFWTHACDVEEMNQTCRQGVHCTFSTQFYLSIGKCAIWATQEHAHQLYFFLSRLRTCYFLAKI